MWYQFDENGICVGCSNGEIAPMTGITSVYWEEVHYDIERVFLVDGEMKYIVHNTGDEKQ